MKVVRVPEGRTAPQPFTSISCQDAIPKMSDEVQTMMKQVKTMTSQIEKMKPEQIKATTQDPIQEWSDEVETMIEKVETMTSQIEKMEPERIKEANNDLGEKVDALLKKVTANFEKEMHNIVLLEKIITGRQNGREDLRDNLNELKSKLFWLHIALTKKR